MDTQEVTSPAPGGQAEPLHPFLQEQVKYLERRIAGVRAMAPAVALAEELEKRYPGLYYTKSADVFFNEFNIYFQFKTMAQAAALLRVLAEEKGLHMKRAPNKSDDGGTYYWHLPGLCIIGSFSSPEADACRLVQVGVKEVPVYELRCGDKPAEVPAPTVSVPALAPVELEGVPF